MVFDMSRQRWVGGIALVMAGAMLVCGETVLKGKLAGLGFLAYWLACLVATVLAIVMALRDLRMQQRSARVEQRELLESTLKEIGTEASTRARHPSEVEPDSQHMA